jgi:TolB-like protein
VIILNQALYALRRDLGSVEAITGTQDLRLNGGAVWCDVVSFEAALARGDITEATTLYTGPFLDGFRLPSAPEFERWVDEERTALQHRYHEALEHLARAAESEGAYALAVKWWRRRAADDPLNARVAVAMMRALTAAGDRNGALRLARMFEALIAQELELPPDREVVELAKALRTAQQAPPDDRRKDERPCIAVLPFASIGDADDATRAAWRDGLLEDIIHSLAAEPSLRVPARSATMRLGPAPALEELRTTLGASLALEGSVRFNGDTVRISARLVDATGSHTLWADRQDRATADMHDVHDDMATRVARVVRNIIRPAQRS